MAQRLVLGRKRSWTHTNMERRAKKMSTNPFDSSSDEESLSSEVFHDCNDMTHAARKRQVNLDFNFDTSQVTERPALNFDVHPNNPQENIDFFSPLESAMLLESAGGEESDVDSVASSEAEGANDDEEHVVTAGESLWLTVMRKAASSALMLGTSPRKLGEEDGQDDIDHGGQLSHRGSQASFSSARSIGSVDGDSVAGSMSSRHRSFKVEAGMSTPPFMSTPPRRGSLKGEHGKVSPGVRTSKHRSTLRRPKRTSVVAPPKPSPVLEKLERNDRDTDLDATAAPWTKMILLEELGTASSWTVLVLPYVAFVICVLLDTHSPFMTTNVGPLSGSSSCANATTDPINVPIVPAPLEPCSYPFALKTGEGILASRKDSYLFQLLHYNDLMKTGTAFTSGPIERISPMSTFLNGDASYQLLTTDEVALVSQGMVLVSTVVLQRSVDWVPVFVAKPEPLSMACIPNIRKGQVPSPASLWNCTSPRVIDVLFPMPGTAVLSEGDIQVNILYSLFDPVNLVTNYSLATSAPYMDVQGHETFVFYEHSELKTIFFDKRVSHPDILLSHLVRSSSYTIEHESHSYTVLKSAMRLFTLVVTFCFTIFWCWSLGCKGFFAGANCCCLDISCRHCIYSDEDTAPLAGGRKRANWMWWESPWIVFPERRYLLVLLICLMMIQNPLLAFVYYERDLFGSAYIRTIADIIVGIGVHGVLMMWLCLVQGVRYHTAAFARRRVKNQRQLLELRRAARFMAQNENENYGTDEDHVSRYITDYFDRFGDVDGSAASSLAIRLKNDPCGDEWADFLIRKLALFLAGITAVIVAAVCRFPGTFETAADLTPSVLHRFNTFYIAGSLTQIFVMFSWIFLILRNTFLSGAKLRKEPFLSTRPAQLAYRVLFGMCILGVGALLVPLCIALYRLVRKWTLGQTTLSHNDTQARDKSPIVDILLRILWTASQKVPYSGTAASIGPGKILFVTTIVLVSAFIFLPAGPYRDTDNDEHKREQARQTVGDERIFSLALLERIRQQRDKRLVVGLARRTHTWRALPLPIKKVSVVSKLLSGSSFQINHSERSVVYFGRYTPVFCVEIACWLLEASWQAYYSPKEFKLDDWAPGRMDLNSIGLKLDHSIIDESTHTQAYVASNISSQVDGEEDSIIVVAFRGTASTRNMKTDLTFRQVPLYSQIKGANDHQATFEVRPDRIDAYDRDGFIWETPVKTTEVLSLSPAHSQSQQTFNWHEDAPSSLAAMSSGAKAVIGAVPMARQALPCVHEGFLEAYSHIRRRVMESLLDVLQRQFHRAVARAKLCADGSDEPVPLVLPRIYCTGHSLGGSIAQLLALDIASNCELVVDVDCPIRDGSSGAEDFFLLPSPAEASPETRSKDRMRFFSFDEPTGNDDTPTTSVRTMRLQPPLAVYTYGQPRVGNHAFARLYKQRVPHTFRVAYEGDAFTAMPPTILCGWSGIYKHAGLEVMLDEGCTGNILVGPTVVETLFRFTKMRTSVAAHSMERYRNALESALAQDEIEEYYRGHGTLKEDRGSGVAYSSAPLPEWLTHVKRSESEDA